jgi:hypothetical protein
MGFKHYGVNTGGLPIEYLKRFTEKYSIPIFIETGTAGGDSVRAAAPLFKECHTIEIVGGRPAGEFPENVTLHEGNSALLLSNIAKKFPHDNIFFWLDAHWSEPHESEEHTDECPILAEIEAIAQCKQRALIMIDDARLFYGRPPWPCNPSKWPRFMHVFEKLRACFPDHVVSIVDDYIICFPLSMNDAHNWEWYDNYTKRFPTDEMKLKQSVKDSYQALLRYME